jgi:alpha-galactosidase
MIPLSRENETATFQLGTLTARYAIRGDTVEFCLLPEDSEEQLVERRRSGRLHPELPNGHFREAHNTTTDSLVQVALRGQPAHRMWTAGGTMRNSAATESLKFKSQQVAQGDSDWVIRTVLESPLGFEARHCLRWTEGDASVRVETSLTNTSDAAHEIEMLSSFSMTGLTPFAEDDAPGRLKLHRFRSAWSNEAIHAAQDFGDLGMERSWGGGPTYLRFGQSGSLPVRKFHPFVAVEDSGAGIFWGAQLAWHGSWQMEVYRRDDPVAISGGLGDFEQSHWMKRLEPGESLTTPTALLSTCRGNIDTLCHRLVEGQSHLAYEEPAHEAELPIIFNEWCSSWGHPTHDYLLRTAERLKSTETGYLVIDDGWAEKPANAEIQFNGDWNVDTKAFPEGLKATTAAIREHGLIPGIWFEFEPCTEGTEAYEKTDHHLHRHGKVLQVGNRHFWDFRDPWTIDYLTEKVIRLLKDNDFGYLKVDYNESIGLGCDGAESLGEGLRQHLLAVKAFFEKIRREVPGIVIENCASGGHRLEPGMIGLTSMSSFSDAHETVEIPIIAAALHRLVPAHKNQVWAVLRPEDSIQRIDYSLAATFLGRMCISGDVVDLSDDRFKRIVEAQRFYQSIAHILRHGRSRLQSTTGKSRRRPTGWQALVRESSDGEELLVVLHTFDQPPGEPLRVALPAGAWNLAHGFGTAAASVEGATLVTPALPPFTGAAWLLKNDPTDLLNP